MVSNGPIDFNYNRDSCASSLGRDIWKYPTRQGEKTRSISDESISSTSSSSSTSSFKSTCSKCAHFVIWMLSSPFIYLRDLIFGKTTLAADIRMQETLQKLRESSLLTSATSISGSTETVSSTGRDFVSLRDSLHTHIISTYNTDDGFRDGKCSILFDLLGYKEIAPHLPDIIYHGHKVIFPNDDGFFYDLWAGSKASGFPVFGSFLVDDGILTYHVSKEISSLGIESTCLRVTTHVDREDVPTIQFDDLDEDACEHTQNELMLEAHKTACERMKQFCSISTIERGTSYYKTKFADLPY